MNMLEKSILLTLGACAEHKAENGTAPLLHALAVGLRGTTDEERVAGFLHDMLRPGRFTAPQLVREGIPEAIVHAVQLLTRPDGVTETEHARTIAASLNPLATRVKINDLRQHLAEADSDSRRSALAVLQQAMEQNSRVTLHQTTKDGALRTAVFAAGCFWGVQHYFDRTPGVTRTLAGYTGGKEPAPTYEDVRAHRTSHLEAVLVEFDPRQVDYRTLVQLFFEIHDPAQTDGQGPDLGPQYLSGLFYADEEQRQTALQLTEELRRKGYEVNTRIEPAGDFWTAEAYHQHYYSHTGGSPYCHIRQKKF